MDTVASLRRLFFYQNEHHAEQWFDRATNRGGYLPACELVHSETCRNRKAELGGYRCRTCPDRVLAKLTDERITDHLRGRVTLGAYQLRDDGTAGWLCIDIDADEDTDHARENARELTQLLLAQARRIGLPTYPEWTGNKGYHIWAFCPEGAPAHDLRRLGRWLVACTIAEHGEFAGIHAETFPKQNQLDPSDPFGNLVKVPLGTHRKSGKRCLFVGPDLVPLTDQDALVASIVTVTADDIRRIIDDWVPGDPQETGDTQRAAKPSPQYNLADNIAQAARNLERLGAHRRDNYDEWCAVGMALSELGDVGLALWDQWSRQSSKYKEGDCAAKWSTFEPGHGLTLGSLVHWSREDSGGATVSRPIQGEAHNCTDMGNAQRLVIAYQDAIRYSHVESRWYTWSQTRWVADQTGEVSRYAKATIREIYREAADCLDDARRKELSGWARRSESEGRLSAMVSLAQSEPGIPVLPCDLDADPWLLNVMNGTIDLRTGELKPHRREDMITKLCPVIYDPTARSDIWDRFLAHTTQDDAEMQTFLARAVGYSLVGAPSEEKLFFVHGPAAAGKSTFIEAIKAMLGDYAMTADFETFIKRSMVTGGPRNDIARLAGARFVASIEVDEGKKLAEGLLKTITGGDTVTARHLYKEAFEFSPQFTLWLCANHAPQVKDDDDAMWRRILRVPFQHVVPENDRDPNLKRILRDPIVSGPAILAWAVRGCLEWLAHGLSVPALVTQATDDYRKTQDPLADFIAECCVLSPVANAPSAELRRTYEDWARETGQKPIGGNDFTYRLKMRGCKPSQLIRVRGNPTRCWVGIGLQGVQDERLIPDTLETPGVTVQQLGGGVSRNFSRIPPREGLLQNDVPSCYGVTPSAEEEPEESNDPDAVEVF